MKKNFKLYSLFILGLLVMGGFGVIQSQGPSVGSDSELDAGGIEFFHGSFAEAQAKAKAEGKLIFLDAYTSWCGPCRMMASTTFQDAAVGQLYNEKFINLKIDMEKGEGPVLARKFRVMAYPTLLYMNAEGKVVHKELGFKKAPQFKAIGQKVVNK